MKELFQSLVRIFLALLEALIFRTILEIQVVLSLKFDYFLNISRYQANIYLLKVNSRNALKKCKICSKLTIRTQERRQWRRSGLFIVIFEHISHLFLMFLLITLSK